MKTKEDKVRKEPQEYEEIEKAVRQAYKNVDVLVKKEQTISSEKQPQKFI